MKKIIFIVVLLLIIAVFFPKPYFSYPGLVPPHIAASWTAPRCIGIEKIQTNRVPDGPDMLCFGIVIK